MVTGYVVNHLVLPTSGKRGKKKKEWHSHPGLRGKIQSILNFKKAPQEASHSCPIT